MTDKNSEPSVDIGWNTIHVGDLIGLRGCNPNTGMPIEPIELLPFPESGFTSILPIAVIKANKPRLRYMFGSSPVLFLGTKRMGPRTVSVLQTKTVLLHRFLFKETVYYMLQEKGSNLEEVFYVIQKGSASANF